LDAAAAEQPALYLIRAQGALRRSTGLHGMHKTVTSPQSVFPVVTLAGVLPGQRALFEVLDVLYMYGLPILTIQVLG
jgi:hypothetical protein